MASILISFAVKTSDSPSPRDGPEEDAPAEPQREQKITYVPVPVPTYYPQSLYAAPRYFYGRPRYWRPPWRRRGGRWRRRGGCHRLLEGYQEQCI